MGRSPGFAQGEVLGEMELGGCHPQSSISGHLWGTKGLYGEEKQEQVKKVVTFREHSFASLLQNIKISQKSVASQAKFPLLFRQCISFHPHRYLQAVSDDAQD